MFQTLYLRRLCGVSVLVAVAIAPCGRAVADDVVIETRRTLCVRFSPDGKTLASCGYRNHVVTFWDVASGKLTGELTMPGKLNKYGSGNSVYAVSWSSDGKLLACGCEDNTVRLFNVKEGKEVAAMFGSEARVRSVDFSPDGKFVASGALEPFAHVWDVETGAQQMEIGPFDRGLKVKYSPDGKKLAIGSDDRLVVWDFEARKACFDQPSDDAVYALSFSSDGKLLASGGTSRTIRIWDLENKAVVRKVITRSAIRCIAFSRDDRFLAGANGRGEVSLYRIQDGAAALTLRHSQSETGSLDLSADGRSLAASGDETIVIWKLPSGLE